MRVSLFCLLITAVLALRTVYADQSVEEDSAVSLDEQANLPLWLQDQPPLPDTYPQIPDTNPVPWSELVAQSYAEGNWEIYQFTPPYQLAHRLTDNPASDIQPRLNRGSTRIAFASNRDGDYEIYTMNLDGTGLVQITNNSSHDGNPSWSPDGTHILFETQRDGQWEVYVMNADGSNQTRLTFDADYDGMPVWSPDGTRIAFVSRRTGGYRIYTMNADGSGLTQRSDQPYSFDPTWSPDSNAITFDADADGDGWQDLWVMLADGTAEGMIYDPYGPTDAWPRAWSQDGRYLAFTEIQFVIYNGAIYWTSAYIMYRDMLTGGISYISFDPYAWNPDWQTTDITLPQSQVNPLPLFSRLPNFSVSWAGSDQISGIASYDVQYRVGENGAWIDWLTYTGQTSVEFTAIPGSTVYFRSRAHDQAVNTESWPPEADAFTTFYSWHLSGGVTDNRGVVLPDVPISINPAPMNGPVITDENGRYHTLLASSGTHTIDITQMGYGDFTATPLNTEETSQTYLPPAENVLLNSSFESGTTSWETGGTTPIAPIYTTYNTGDTAVSSAVTCPVPCVTPAEPFWDNEDNYYAPDTVSDSLGNLHMIYRWSDGVYHMIRTPQGDWSLPIQITDAIIPFDRKPLAVIDQNDTIHVVWGKGTNEMYYTQKTSTGNWEEPILVPTNYHSPEGIAVDGWGNLHVLGEDFSGLYYIKRHVNGVWGTSTKVNEDDNNLTHGSVLAITPDNTVHIMWVDPYSDSPSHNHSFFYRQLSPEGIWLPIEHLYTYQNHLYTYVQKSVVDVDGALHLFWENSYLVYHATKHPVTGWAESPIEIPNAGNYMDVAVSRQNVFHLLSHHIDGNMYYQYRYPGGYGWSTAEVLASSDYFINPLLVVDRFGILHMVWEDVTEGLYYATTETADSPSTGYLQQTVTIPADMLNPTLSFMYRTSPDLPDDDTALVVSVTAGITTTQVYTAAPAGNWTLGWVDMQAWAGQTVTVRFAVQQAADDPYLQLFLDSVSLGAAHSDIWVGGTSVTTAEPGDEVVYQLHYGNAGGAGAEDVTITYTLPAEITFVSASVPPITPTTQALVWELGSLPAGDGPYSITITGTVAANVPYLTELTNTAVITAAAPELRTANNTAVSITFIGRLAYLPVIFE